MGKGGEGRVVCDRGRVGIGKEKINKWNIGHRERTQYEGG